MYRGVSMIEGWPEKIQAAQAILTCEINGAEVPRALNVVDSDSIAIARVVPRSTASN